MADLHPILEGDYSTLADFCAAFPGDGDGAELWRARFRFWWEGNPAFSPDWPRGFWLEADGHAVGMLAVIPSRILMGGEPHLAAGFSTWRVLQPWRGESMALLVAAIRPHRQRVFLDTTPTPEVVEMLTAMRYTNLAPQVTERVGLPHPAALGEAVAARLGGGGAKAAALAYLAWPLLELLRHWGRWRARGVMVTNLSPANRNALSDWQRARRPALPILSNRMTVEELAWRAWDNPRGNHLLLGAWHQGRLGGWGLFLRESVQGRRFLVCLEAEAEPSAWVALLSEAFHQARRDGAWLRVPAWNPELEGAAQTAGIRLSRRQDWTLYVRLPSGVSRDALASSPTGGAWGDRGL